MKNDIAKRYRTRFIINLIIAAFITCVIESLLIFNIGRLILAFGENSDAGSISNITMLLFVFSAVLIFGIVFYLLQLRSINYIADLSRAMEDIADGKLDTKVRVEGDDEFSQMAENLNNLGADLEKLLEVEREAEKSKTDLITNIAHDLRTPLTSIIGYLDLLSGKNSAYLSDDQRQKIGRAHV